MAKPRDVVVRFLADTRDFLRGTDKIEDAYRDMSRGADATADAGEDSARKIARAYDKAGDQIRRDNATTKRDTKQAFAETGAEAGGELAQNLGEAISSGDVSGLVSGTLGGLASSLGATGPIGLALAAVGGVAASVFASMSAAAAKAAADAEAAFEDIKSGASREAKLSSVLKDRFGSVTEGLEAISRLSEASGLSVEAISDAIVTGGPAAKTMSAHFEDIMRNAYETTGELDRSQSFLIEGEDLLNSRAVALERAAAAAKIEKSALSTSEGILRRSASYYAARGSALAAGGSAQNQQLGAAARYVGGKRSGS